MSELSPENILHRERAVQNGYFDVSDKQKEKWGEYSGMDSKDEDSSKKWVVHNVKGHREDYKIKSVQWI